MHDEIGVFKEGSFELERGCANNGLPKVISPFESEGLMTKTLFL